MNTSKTIKANQYNPIQGTRNSNESWTFASESRERVRYSVRRDGTEYKCGCPARGLCKHITSAVLDDAATKFAVVQVWTDQADAQRQKRRTLQMTANGKVFWVTYAQESPLHEVIRFSTTWGAGKDVDTADLYYRNADGSDRCQTVDGYAELAQMAKVAGWQRGGVYWTPPKGE